jgi:3-dehydrosphinganine reductase
MCKLVAPLMMRRRQGHIVNTSSVAGFIGVFGYTAYGASKFAVRGFTDVLRSELKPYGVRVSILFPPDTDTPQLWEENKIKPAETRALAGSVKVMRPEEVARQLLRGVARGQYMILPGLESKLVYMAAGLLGAKLHWFLDAIVRKTQQERGGPPPVRDELLAELYSLREQTNNDG